MIDLEVLKLKVKIETLAEGLGLEFSYNSDRLAKAKCPLHGDNDPSFIVDKISQVARCYGAGCVAEQRMDHIKLIRVFKHLSEDEAIDFFYEFAGEERPIDSLSDYLRRVLSRLQANVSMDIPKMFFSERGITPETLHELNIGYSPSFEVFKQVIADVPSSDASKLELMQPHLFDNAIIYPQFDGLGRMAGFRSRPFTSSQKYYANSRDYPLKASRLYGLHLVRGSQIVLVEGPNDVLGLRSKGIKNVAGLMGCKTKDIEQYLTERGFSDIIFLADGDDAGKLATVNAPAMLRVNCIPNGMDPDEYAHKEGLLGIVKLINSAQFPFWLRVESKLRNLPSDETGKIMLIKSIANDISDGLPRIVLRKVQQKLAQVLQVPEEDVDSIFELVKYDSSSFEAKVISHVVLGGLLTEDIKLQIQPWMFGNPLYRRQYEDLLKGHNLSEYVSDKGLLTEYDLERFMDIAKRRKVKTILSGSISHIMNIGESLDDSVSIAMSRLYDMAYQGIHVISAREQLEVGIHNAMERYNNQDKLLGLSFGDKFPVMNDVLQGLRPNTMYILAANTGVGKSALALDWAIAMAYYQNIPVLWVSLEMSQLDISNRIIAKVTGVSAKRLMNGRLDPGEVAKITTYPLQYMNKPLHIVSTGGITMNQLVALIRKMKASKGIQAVFIDYIGLIKGDQKVGNSYERVGAISDEIKSVIAQDKAIGLPVIALSQLNRQAVKTAIPITENMAESYKVGMDSDVVILLKKRSQEEILADKNLNRDWGNILMNIDKNRSGEDKVYQGLIFDKISLAFKEVGV